MLVSEFDDMLDCLRRRATKNTPTPISRINATPPPAAAPAINPTSKSLSTIGPAEISAVVVAKSVKLLLPPKVVPDVVVSTICDVAKEDVETSIAIFVVSVVVAAVVAIVVVVVVVSVVVVVVALVVVVTGTGIGLVAVAIVIGLIDVVVFGSGQNTELRQQFGVLQDEKQFVSV